MAREHVPRFGMWEDEDIQYTKHFQNPRKHGAKAFNPNDPEENPELFMSIENQYSRKEQQKPSPRKNNRDFPKANTSGLESFANVSFPNSSASQTPQFPDSALSTESMDSGPVYEKSASLPTFGDWERIEPKSSGHTIIFNEMKEKKHSAATNLPTATNTTPNKQGNQRPGRKSERVPRFGMWEAEDIAFNPNDPEENPEPFMSNENQYSRKEHQNPSPPKNSGDYPRTITPEMEAFANATLPNSSASQAPRISASSLSTESMDTGSVHQKPASLPKFGEWEGINPKSVDYTLIFNVMKEKKHSAATNVPTAPNTASSKQGNQRRGSKMLCCVFPLAR